MACVLSSVLLPEILSELLGYTGPEKTLDQIVEFIATKEQAKVESGAMGDSAAST